MNKLCFKEMKKKFEDWQKNPLSITYPMFEVMVVPDRDKYKLYHVICKYGRMAVKYKYITTFKHFKVLDKWRKTDHVINYCIASLPLLK